MLRWARCEQPFQLDERLANGDPSLTRQFPCEWLFTSRPRSTPPKFHMKCNKAIYCYFVPFDGFQRCLRNSNHRVEFNGGDHVDECQFTLVWPSLRGKRTVRMTVESYGACLGSCLAR